SVDRCAGGQVFDPGRSATAENCSGGEPGAVWCGGAGDGGLVAVQQPQGHEALVLLVALGGVVLAEVVVLAAEGDDGLAGGRVDTVRRDAGLTRAGSFARKPGRLPGCRCQGRSRWLGWRGHNAFGRKRMCQYTRLDSNQPPSVP